jgi:hypothetical protein
MLAGMNWKRGILLAAINLAAAVPMMVLLDARDVRYLRENEAAKASEAPSTPPVWVDKDGGLTTVEPAATGGPAPAEEETVIFDPCRMWVTYPPQEYVVQFGNLPVFAVSGWRDDCPAKWTISGLIRGTGFLTRQRLAAQRRVDLWLCALIAAQWLLVGSFPLTMRRRIWQEPGSLITSCSVIGCLLALISAIDVLAKAPALVAGLAWLWWAGLVVWTGVRLGGLWVSRRWRRAA